MWRELPFREDLDACEDKELSWRVVASGRTIALDPELSVPNHHRKQAGVVPLWRRVHKEARVLAELGVLPRPTYSEPAL